MGLLCSVVMPFASGLNGDSVVNDYAIGGLSAASPTGDVTAAVTGIVGIYTSNLYGTSYALGSRLSPALSRTAFACHVKVYDIGTHLDGTPHGSPFRTDDFTLAAATDPTGLPEEVALVATLEAAGRAGQLVETADGIDADLLRDRPRQRYTGRVYIGPWCISATAQANPDSFARPNGQDDLLRAHIARQAEYIKTNSGTGWLGVWSRKNEAIREIDQVAVDNAWDTQRRRGAHPTRRLRTAVVGAGTQVELAA